MRTDDLAPLVRPSVSNASQRSKDAATIVHESRNDSSAAASTAGTLYAGAPSRVRRGNARGVCPSSAAPKGRRDAQYLYGLPTENVGAGIRSRSVAITNARDIAGSSCGATIPTACRPPWWRTRSRTLRRSTSPRRARLERARGNRYCFAMPVVADACWNSFSP